MKVEIEIGDVVGLRSGGPNMTVTYRAPQRDGSDIITCVWFDEGKVNQSLFDHRVLDIVTKGQKRPVEPQPAKPDIPVADDSPTLWEADYVELRFGGANYHVGETINFNLGKSHRLLTVQVTQTVVGGAITGYRLMDRGMTAYPVDGLVTGISTGNGTDARFEIMWRKVRT